MALPSSRNDREYKKFVETDGGDVAVRTVGDTSTLAGGASQASGLAVYYAKPTGANGDGVSAYASATSITITGLPFTFAATDVESVEQIPTSGTSTVYSDKADFSVSGTTLTVTGSSFDSTDVFVVKLTGKVRGYDSGFDSDKVSEIAQERFGYAPENLVDTTNLSAATHYYPSSTGGTMDSWRDQSLSGKFIDADGTVTVTLEVTNDEDASSADWVTSYFYDDNSDLTVNTFTVTNGTLTFLASINNNIFRRYRWVVVCSGATNTVILKGRKKAL